MGISSKCRQSKVVLQSVEGGWGRSSPVDMISTHGSTIC